MCSHYGLTIPAGAREAPYLSTPRVNSLKKLYYATSEPSGADGLARFTNLTFNQQGTSGEYRITFFCDGIASNESNPIDVKTSGKFNPTHSFQASLAVALVQ